MRRIALWAAVGGYMATIFVLSAQSNPLPALTSSVNDKILHAVEYGGLGLLLAAALRGSGVPIGRASVLAILCASVYGATDELHQLFVPGRDSDVFDWLADTLGAMVAICAGSALGAGLRRRSASS